MKIQLWRHAAILLAAVSLAAEPALAHHVMGGRTPAGFLQGLLSGLGHPLIGLDHLAFLAAIGVVVGVGRLPLWLPISFVAASAIGTALHIQGWPLPGAEFIVAASVLAIGAVIARGLALAPVAWACLLAAAGLFHGYTYGESIFGAEATPVAAYLLGLVIVQSALAIGIALVCRRTAAGVNTLAPRLAGAAVAGIGIATLAGHITAGG